VPSNIKEQKKASKPPSAMADMPNMPPSAQAAPPQLPLLLQ
jgi:hypothetical protein